MVCSASRSSPSLSRWHLVEAGGSCSAAYRSIWVWKQTSAPPAKHIQPWWWTTSTRSWLAWSAAGVEWRPDNDLPGARRCYIDDPFGNRVELIAQPEQAPPASGGDNVTSLRSA